jgi:hypothetical protein
MNSLLDNAPNPLKADKLINKWRDLNVEQSLKVMTTSTSTAPMWFFFFFTLELNVSSHLL